MREPGRECVQEHASESHAEFPANKAPVELKVAVLVVASDGKTQMRDVDADLVRAPGLQLRLQQRERAQPLLQREIVCDATPSGSIATRRSPVRLMNFVSGSRTCCRSLTQSPATSNR